MLVSWILALVVVSKWNVCLMKPSFIPRFPAYLGFLNMTLMVTFMVLLARIVSRCDHGLVWYSIPVCILFITNVFKMIGKAGRTLINCESKG